MASRFGQSNLHQRDARSALFEGYNSDNNNGKSKANGTSSPNRHGSYGYVGAAGAPAPSAGYGLPPSSQGTGTGGSAFRPATPNRKGQYSDAVLNELESQNDSQVEGILGKVRMLKDMSVAIGDEIRESSALAEKMNDGFDRTRVRLRGTMNRMLVMAERTGVPWKVWLAFFAAVILLFMYVWLF